MKYELLLFFGKKMVLQNLKRIHSSANINRENDWTINDNNNVNNNNNSNNKNIIIMIIKTIVIINWK